MFTDPELKTYWMKLFFLKVFYWQPRSNLPWNLVIHTIHSSRLVGCLWDNYEMQFQRQHERESEVSQSCPTLCAPMDCSLPVSSICPWDFPGESTGMGRHFLLKRDLPDPEIEPGIVGRRFYRLSHRGSPEVA